MKVVPSRDSAPCGEAASSRFGSVPCTWHKAMINEICRMSSGSTPRRDNANNFNGTILWVSSGELKKKFVLDTNEKISQEAARASHLKMYEPGAVVAAIYGLEAAGIRGTASIIKKQCTISQACMAFTDFKGIDNEFFYYWYILNGPRIGHRYAQGTKQQNLSTEIVGTLQICFPPLPEQRKIAAILATQDKVIELYERKIEQLQLLKKNCLRKMFPRHGSDTPEVRFRGFTGTWERKRLGDLFTEYAEKGRPELPALVTIQGGGTVLRDESDRKLQYDKHSLSNYKVANKGDFIVHLRSFEGGLEIVTTPGLISPAYHVFHGKKIDPRFYYAYFRSVDFIECDLKPHVYGIRDGRSIDIEGMKTIMIPHVSRKEQQAIGNCIESFDRLIALNQRKCDEEKQKKKALMQLLLTGIVRVGEAASCRLERAGNEAAGSRFSTRIAKV